MKTPVIEVTGSFSTFLKHDRIENLRNTHN